MREESSKPAELSLVSTETVCREASLLTLSLSFMLQLSRGLINYKQRLLPKEKKRTLIAYYLRGILLAGSSFFTTLFSYDFPLAHCVTNTLAAALVFLLFSFTL